MEHKKSTIKYACLAVLTIAILLILDQWTKWLAVKHLAGQSDITLIPGVLQLHYLENKGAAFGLMENKVFFFIILTTLFLFLAAIIFLRMPKTRRFIPLHVIAVVLLAGAFGNLIDRVRLGYVVDFIYFSLINFPVFNVADIYVTVSGVFLFIYVCFYYKEEDFTFLTRKGKAN